ncbi:hypothetical protein V7654_18970 [Bacillus sp. JJ1609]|uniref:hypothetical protein n=1 Tax=Bacillus sp. JJ1609 TaxID=3122977 RepID=UPI002FFFF023
MAKIPIQPIIKTLNTHGPKVSKFVKENWKDISKVVAVVGPFIPNKNSDKTNSKEEKMHFRKTRYIEYKGEILKNLETKNRREIFRYKLEVDQFINQIKQEGYVNKNPLKIKRINNWKEILLQLDDRLATKDYEEYLLIYNNLEYQSIYFEGFDGQIKKFKKLLINESPEVLYEYIKEVTGKEISQIKRDFM